MITVTYEGPVFKDEALSLEQVLDIDDECCAFYGSAGRKDGGAPSVKGVFFACGDVLVHFCDEPWWWTELCERDRTDWTFTVRHMVNLSITATTEIGK